MNDHMQERIRKFDPRTLFIINIVFCITVFVVSSKLANHLCLSISFILMLIVGMYKKSMKYLFFYGTIAILDFLAINYNLGRIQIFISLIFYILCKFIPIFMIASILVNNIKTNEIITSLEKMKIPKGIMLSIVVSLRFVPTIKEEVGYIKESMSMRGIEISPKNLIKKPMITLEYSIIPLLFRSLKIAEELTATALTRGVENNIKRTSYFDVSFKRIDYFTIIFVLLSITALFIIDKSLIKF